MRSKHEKLNVTKSNRCSRFCLLCFYHYLLLLLLLLLSYLGITMTHFALSPSSPPISGSHSAAQAGREIQLSQPLSSAVIAEGSWLLPSKPSIHFLYAGNHTERVAHRSRQRSFEDSPPPHLSLETSGRRSTAYNYDSLGLL